MRPALFALLMALGSSGTAAEATDAAPKPVNTAGWKEFQIPAGRFKVLMPGTPKTSRQTIPTEIGKVASTRYTVTDAANVTYDVLLNDYPKAGVARASPHRLLDSVRDGLVFQTKGKLISDRRMTLATFPGRDLEIRGSEGLHYRARLVWVETRLYQVMAVSPGEPRPDANVFFDSFQITGKP